LPRFEIIQPSFEAEAMAISGDGRVVVGGIYTRASFERSVGFSWTEGTLEIVEPGPGYTDSWLSYVNHDGTIRFGYLYADGPALSARWDDGGLTDADSRRRGHGPLRMLARGVGRGRLPWVVLESRSLDWRLTDSPRHRRRSGLGYRR
jgi:hypothetical protein